jgi:trans-aconitate 2-methyltransferase
MTWDPDIYLSQADHRTRPARDLLARIQGLVPRRIVDLGCGPGNSTALLCARWPEAKVLGVDSSAAMLERARESGLAVEWQEADIATWETADAPDLIFANAVLHWLPDHEKLIPKLLSFLAPGGLLALQMPRNFAAETHRLLRQLAAEEPWSAPLAGALREEPVADPAFYHELLSGRCRSCDIWETIYYHRLEGPDPALVWIRGTALTPLRDRLSEQDYLAFEAALAPRLREAYPALADGSTLFPFRRLFILATRPL